MNSNEMTVAQRIAFLERAVEELRLELCKVEAGLGGNAGVSQPEAHVHLTLKEQHAALTQVLKDQQSALTKILNEALSEMEKLRRGSSA